MNKKVSIILPVYNSEKTIHKTIESILIQDYPNYELIIVNDGSIDKTNDICNEYSKKNSKIKYFYKENSGVSDTRNYGMKKATGYYIMFVDSDDIYLENMISVMVNSININNSDMCICGYERVNEKNNRVVKKSVSNNYINNIKDYELFIIELQNKNLFNQIWNKIYRFDMIKDINLKFEKEISLGEDFRFVMQYVQNSKKIQIIDNILYKYTNSTDGLNLKYIKDKLDINIKNVHILEKYFSENDFNIEYINLKYILSYASELKNINRIKNKEDKEKNKELYIKNIDIINNLNKISKKTKKIKIYLLSKLLNIRSKTKMFIVINIIKLIDYVNKKKLGY